MTATTLELANATMQESAANARERAHEAAYGQAWPSLDIRARKAAARYLELRGYEVLDRDWECDGDSVDIVCWDVDGTLVFVDVSASANCFPREECIRGRRARLEAMAMSYLAEHEYLDVAVRFDSVSIVPVAEGRAFLRHEVNALGAM